MIKVDVKTSKKKNDTIKYQMAKEFRSFTRQQLARECNRLFSIANKRITRLQNSEVLSPALHAVVNSGGKFYAKGADLKQLQHEYARCVNFLNMNTSTVTGARQYEKTITEKLGGHKLSKDQKSLLFKAFRAIEKLSPSGVRIYGSDRLVQYLANEINSEDENIMSGVGSQDWEHMIEKVINELNSDYEKSMDEFYNSITDIFTF